MYHGVGLEHGPNYAIIGSPNYLLPHVMVWYDVLRSAAEDPFQLAGRAVRAVHSKVGEITKVVNSPFILYSIDQNMTSVKAKTLASISK